MLAKQTAPMKARVLARTRVTLTVERTFVALAATAGALALAQVARAEETASPRRLVYMEEVNAVKRIVQASATDGGGAVAITSGSDWALYPDVTADGKAVAYVTGPDDTHLGVVVQHLDTGLVERFTAAEGQHLHPKFSGDGRVLAYSAPATDGAPRGIVVLDLVAERARGPVSQVVDADGRVTEVVYATTPKALPVQGECYFPAPSSDGSVVLMQCNRGAAKVVVRYDRSAAEARDVTAADGVAMAPALSADDARVAYTSKVGAEWDLFVQELNVANAAPMRVTSGPAHDFAPTWRPDGGLLFAGDQEGSFSVYQLAAEGVAALLADPAAPLPTATLLATSAEGGDLYAPSISGSLTLTQGVKAPIPAPARSSFGAVYQSGKIFVAGGHQGHEHTYPSESFMARLDVYDVATDRWSQGAELSVPRHGFGLAAHGGYVFAFGGFAYSDEHKPKWKSVDLIERYDVASDRWEVVGHLPRARSSNVVAQVGAKAYLIGGWDSTPKFPGDADGRFHPEIDVVDLETLSVETLPVELPAPLRRALTGVVRERAETRGPEIWLVGGIGEGADHFALLDQVTVLDVETMTFRAERSLPFATFAPAAGFGGDGKALHVFGGMHKVGPLEYVYVNHVYELAVGGDAATPWTHLGRHLVESKGFSQVVELPEGALAVLGGHTYELTDDGPVDHPVATFEIVRP
jgi:hypothetical protein